MDVRDGTNIREHAEREAWRVFAGLHRMLRRLAGQFPDDLLAECRATLAAGDLSGLAVVVLASAARLRVPLTAAGFELLHEVRALLDHDGEGLAGFGEVLVSEADPPVGHGFAPVSPRLVPRPEATAAQALDLTGDGVPARSGLIDGTDERIVAWLAGRDGVIGAWRSWRSEPPGSVGEPPDGRRVLLVEVGPEVEAWDLTRDLQRVLADEPGEGVGRVEVYWSGEALAGYQLAARSGGALVWARDAPPIRIAPAFDGFARAGNLPVADPPGTLGAADREDLLIRLSAGRPIGGVGGPGVDLVEPGRGRVVPSGQRTDGHWVWSETTVYYLTEYGLAPDPELVRHLRERPVVSVVNDASLFRAELAVRTFSSGLPEATDGAPTARSRTVCGGAE